MAELSVVRWTRFGKDRLYVKDASGADLGWVDCATGEVTTSRPELAIEIARAAAACGVQTPIAQSPVAPPSCEPVAVTQLSSGEATEPPTHVDAPLAPPVPVWHDLAQNRPGQAARARAQQELAAMKQRSQVGTWLARAVDAKTDERAWRVGADGEETIGARLEKLVKDGWYVLHSVPVGTRGSDIDHVVIGPPGVFTVTKKHPGKKVWVSEKSILVNGQRTDYLRNSRFEGERASRLLTAAAGFPVFVKPVLIFTTGTLVPDVTIKSRPHDVGILDRMDVPRAFKRSTVILTLDQVDTVFEIARRSTTWIEGHSTEERAAGRRNASYTARSDVQRKGSGAPLTG